MTTATTVEADRPVRYLADALVAGDRAGTIHRPGALDVEGGRVVSCGPAEGAPPAPDRVVSVGGLLMPGLVNAHAHTPMTLMRGAGDGLPLARWLAEAVWPLEAEMSDDDVRWGMLLGAAEMLSCGVTTTCEQYLHAAVVAEAALEAGIRCLLTPGIFEIPGSGGSWRDSLDEAARVHAAYDGKDGRLAVGLGPHSAYALPDEGLRATAELACELGAVVQIHVAETEAEERELRAGRGCGSVELLERTGVLGGPVLAAHAVWVTDADLDRMAAHGVAVAHCPKSNAKLGSGVARLTELLGRGITVGLGTDGPASNDTLDLWEELRMAPLLARATVADPTVLPASEAFWLATGGGADALGLPVGSLAPGRAADFVRVALDDAWFAPVDDDRQLLAHLVWSADSRLVTDVWVGGRQVVAAGACTTIDVAEARREVAARARRLRG